MIEIALALGIIGFALVAIIGILPAGLNVQRQAREDTLIAQDGPFLMQAIRSGAPALLTNGQYLASASYYNGYVSVGGAASLDFLTNYIDQIVVSTNGILHTNSPSEYQNGAMILGLLSKPEYFVAPGVLGPSIITTAKMRGFSGAATEQGGSNAVIAFRYYMDVEITPFNTFSQEALDLDNNGQYGTNAAIEAMSLNQNLFDVRLKFRWPVRPNGTVGPGRQTYQSLVSANIASFSNNINGVTYWFLQPANYAFSTNNPL
jgi:hypothetical protein